MTEPPGEQPAPPNPPPGAGYPPLGPSTGAHPYATGPQWPGYAPPGYPPVGQWPPPGPPVAFRRPVGDPTLAEWWERLLARLIDGTILSVIISPAYVLLVFSISDDFLAIMRRSAEGRLVDVQDLLALEVTTLKWGFLMAPIAAVLYFVYDGIQHAVWGRTLGKRLLKIEVIAMSTRVRVTRGAAWRRAAVYALPPAVPIIGSLFALANGLWLFQDPMARQCLHDKAAGTVVVKARGPGTTTPV
ncbi:hypothetical protein GCM10023194_20900 [Planotetraspora phitsanulokensis]|uniref:RDD family protein n=1 Tax=Planotetraspora phitsanulokensis TaxID=575192 RepID=A0A8J3U654_9ACTN|nr:RDD family protein [Planotetraspora phitsanulokensis]